MLPTPKVDRFAPCALCDVVIDRLRLQSDVCMPCLANAWEHAESFGGLLPVKIARYRKWIERQLEAKRPDTHFFVGEAEKATMIEGRA